MYAAVSLTLGFFLSDVGGCCGAGGSFAVGEVGDVCVPFASGSGFGTGISAGGEENSPRTFQSVCPRHPKIPTDTTLTLSTNWPLLSRNRSMDGRGRSLAQMKERLKERNDRRRNPPAAAAAFAAVSAPCAWEIRPGMTTAAKVRPTATTVTSRPRPRRALFSALTLKFAS